MQKPLRSLRTQLALTFGTLVAVLAIGLCLLFGELLKYRLQQQAAASLHLVANYASNLLATELQRQSQITQVLAENQELWKDGLDSERVSAMLERLQRLHPHNVWIGVTDQHGIVRSATRQMLRGVDASARPWFQHGIKAPYTSEVHTAKLLANMLPPSASGELLRLVDFSAPIVRNGRTIGVIAIHINWDWVYDTVENLLQAGYLDKLQTLFIFDAKGQLIYAPQGKTGPYKDLGQSLPYMPNAYIGSATRQASDLAHVTIWKDRPAPYLTAVSTLSQRGDASDRGWHVVVRQPLERAYADAHQAVLISLAVGLGAVVIATWIAWWLARRVSEDLKVLAVSASQVHAGQPRHTIPIKHSNREVFQLSSSLSQMTQKLLVAHTSMQLQVQELTSAQAELQRRSQQLIEAHDEMERQVIDRTQALRLANLELDRQASTDPLTGLLNRRGFSEPMQLAVALAQRSGRPLSVMTMDIDHFKRINDVHGHAVGDQVLIALARSMELRLRATDVLARFGGEEFVVLLTDTSQEAAMHLADALLRHIEQTAMPEVGQITVSIGVSGLRGKPCNDTIGDMLHRSDLALYQAKNSGRNCARWAD